MLPSFRSATLFTVALVASCGAQSHSAAALTSSGQLPLKYTALFGDEASISAIAVDTEGSAYIAGTANSALPVTAGAFQTDYKPATCIGIFANLPPQANPCGVAFAAKLTPDGTALTYLTYLGASDSQGSGISVDGLGNAWITGTVRSSDLPVTAGALQTKLKGPQASFVLKLNPAGSGVLYATYLGGSGDQSAPTSQTVDRNGNLYVAGYTSSTDFPVTSGAFQTDAGQNLNGPYASFVAKFDPTGKLAYSTYFRGGNESITNITSIAADAAGNAYMTGGHRGGSLPTTPGAFQTSATTMYAAFTTKLDTTGSKLLNSEKNPARQNSIVTIYATGLNNTQPPAATGTIAAGAAPLAFEVALNAGSAGVWEITYAGAAPGFVAGLAQINFRVPASSYHGPYDPSLTVSPSVGSQEFVYFYIQ